MALTPEEEAELQQLEAMAQGRKPEIPVPGGLPPREGVIGIQEPPTPVQPIGGLTPEEEQELQELEKEASGENMSFAEKGIEFLSKIGEFADKFTGAPTRKAIGTLQEGGDLGEAASSFGEQFGEDPSLAPTGEEIAMEEGLSNVPRQAEIELPPREQAIAKASTGKEPGPMKVDIPSPAGAAGLAVDVVADPLILIPGVPIVKYAGKGAGKAGKLALKGSAKAADLAAGTKKFSQTVDFMGDAVKNTSEALSKFFKPTLADDFEDLKLVAEKNGINVDSLPESIEFGEGSIISRASRAQAEGPLGEKRLKQFQEVFDQTQNAVENRIEEVAGGIPLDRTSAGGMIRESYDNAVEKFFDGLEVTYDSIVRGKKGPDGEFIVAPEKGLQLTGEAQQSLNSALSGLEKFSKGRMKRGVSAAQRSQGKDLLNAVQAIRETGGSFKQTVEALRMIGEAAFKSKNQLELLPTDVQRLRKLYRTVSDALVDTVRKDVSPEFADELVENNKALSQFFSDKSILSDIGKKNLSDERLFEGLILRGDTKKIDALKRVLPPEDMQKLKGAFLDSLINGKRNIEGEIGFKTAFNQLRNKRQVIEALFEPHEITPLLEVLKFGNRLGNPIMSTSGTGASNVLNDLLSGVKQGISNEAVINRLKETARSGGQQVTPRARVVNFPRSGIGAGAKTGQVISVQEQRARALAGDDKEKQRKPATLKEKRRRALGGK